MCKSSLYNSMTGIDFVDTIVVRRAVEKGTKIVSVKGIKPLKWAGKSFKEAQQERIEKAGDPVLASGKGTQRIRLSKMMTTQVPDTKGVTLLTGKGTGVRIGV